MSGGGGVFGTLARYELLQVLRDRRTLAIAVLAPLVLFPLLIHLGRWSEGRRDRALRSAVHEYAVTGPLVARGRELVTRAAARVPDDGDRSEMAAPRLVEREVTNPDSMLAEGALDLVVRALTPAAYRRWRETTTGPPDPGGRPDGAPGPGGGAPRLQEDGTGAGPPADVPVLVLEYRGSSDFSRAARDAMRERLEAVRVERRDDLFAARGFDVSLEGAGTVEVENVATPRREAGAALAVILTPLVVLLMVGGGTVAAADAISGEKERGTLETLLTTAATPRRIVGAKLLAIVAVGAVVTVVNLLNLLAYVGFGVIEVPERFAASIPPGTLALLLLLYLPIAVLVAAVLLLLSGYARSYKEYQIYALPATLVFLVPSLAAALPGIDLRSAIAAVPLAGISVAVREVLVGEHDALFLGVAFLSTAGAAAWTARITARFLSRERLVTSGGGDEAELVGGEALFRRRVLQWFGVLWVLLLLTSLWLPEDLDLRGRVVVNLVVLFLGGSLAMIWRYDLDPRRALALRPAHPAAWLAVLVGAPSAQLTGVGVARLAEMAFPVPERVMEAFGQYLLPEGMPLWQVLLFLAVLPAICEEIAFRGVLLYGLRRKLPPVRLAVAAGAIFGLFHVELFRIVPTAYVGILLTGVVLLTGSLLPAVAWHALNNAGALAAARAGLSPEQVPPGLIAVGAAGLAVAFWILWRSRRPYPGLVSRSPRPPTDSPP